MAWYDTLKYPDYSEFHKKQGDIYSNLINSLTKIGGDYLKDKAESDARQKAYDDVYGTSSEIGYTIPTPATQNNYTIPTPATQNNYTTGVDIQGMEDFFGKDSYLMQNLNNFLTSPAPKREISPMIQPVLSRGYAEVLPKILPKEISLSKAEQITKEVPPTEEEIFNRTIKGMGSKDQYLANAYAKLFDNFKGRYEIKKMEKEIAPNETKAYKPFGTPTYKDGKWHQSVFNNQTGGIEFIEVGEPISIKKAEMDNTTKKHLSNLADANNEKIKRLDIDSKIYLGKLQSKTVLTANENSILSSLIKESNNSIKTAEDIKFKNSEYEGTEPVIEEQNKIIKEGRARVKALEQLLNSDFKDKKDTGLKKPKKANNAHQDGLNDK